jgi:zinc protease
MKKMLFLWLGLASAAFAVTAPSFPQADSDLPADPAARFGSLPNGIRYVIRPNREPKGRVSLRLLVLSGSLEESDNQQGLAHFLEHMAFNGSAHYPPGTLVEYFQRLGMSFGGDTNAYTSFDHTAYQIELPDTRPGTLADGFRVFSDFANTLLLRPDMIAKERPIILAEKRDRDSPDYREFVAQFRFLLSDSLLSRRFPIGLQSDIEAARRDTFLDLYNTWYRPERMVVIVVGDIDPAAVEPQIAAAFDSVADRAPARPDPDYGHVAVALGLRTAYHSEPEASATDVTIDVMAPYRYQPDTSTFRLRHLPRDLAVAMLNRRLEILSKKEGAPFIRGQVSVSESFNFFHDAGIDITCPPTQWKSALGVGEQELRKALEFGFTEAELREAKANFLNDLQQAVATASTLRSPDVANEIIDSLVERSVFTSPAQDLALYGPALGRVTPDDCAQALRVAFGTPGRYVMVEGNARIPGDAEAAISEAYSEARAVAVQPPKAAATVPFAYTDFGPAGKVVEETHVPDLDLTLVRFANGVRVNLKHTDFQANQIRISVRIGAGKLVEPLDKPGLGLFSELTFGPGGLGKHSEDDLQRILAGRTVGFDFKVGNDALLMGGSTNRTDLLLELELLAAHITDPGYRPEALREARKGINEFYDGLAHSVEGPLQADVPLRLADGDDRFGLPGRTVELSRTLDEERAWLAPQLASGPIEIGIVGDLDPASTIEALAKTFGALPPREPKPAYTAERVVHFPASPFVERYEIPTVIPKAVVALYWPTTDARDIRRTRRLELLSEVFNDRLRIRIREQLGGAYDPAAESETSDTFTNYGFMIAETIVAPERAAEIEKSILAIAADLQAHGVTPDELDRAKRPFLTLIKESARTNDYWLEAVLAECQEFPQRLDWSRSRETDFGAITKADLDDLARTYLAPSRAFQVIATPAVPAKAAP